MKSSLSTVEYVVLVLGLFVLGVGSRLLPHPPDATAVTAVLFASAIYLNPHTSLVLFLSLLLVSDLIIGSYELPVMLSVYGSFLLIGIIGILFARFESIRGRILVLASASVLFFLVTNAAVWFFTPWYPKDFAGLVTAYTLALPFFRNMLVGDFLYVPAVLAACALALKPRAQASSAYAH